MECGDPWLAHVPAEDKPDLSCYLCMCVRWVNDEPYADFDVHGLTVTLPDAKEEIRAAS